MAQDNINNNEEEMLGKAYDARLMKRLLKYARPYWKILLLALFLLVGSTVADLSRPYLVKVAIDDYMNGHSRPMAVYPASSGEEGIAFEGRIYKRLKESPPLTAGQDIYSILYVEKDAYLVQGWLNQGEKVHNVTGIGTGSAGDSRVTLVTGERSLLGRRLTSEEVKIFRAGDIRAISIIGIIFIGVIIVGFMMNYVQIYILSYMGQTIIFTMRQEIFSHLQKMTLSFFDKNPVGRLVTRVTNDTETLNEMYTNVLINLVKDVFILIGVVVIMLRMNAVLALITLAVVPVVIAATVFFRIQARAVYRRVRVALARINAVLSENISGMRVIQIFHREKENMGEFRKINEEYYRAGINEIVVFGIFRPVIEMLASLAMALVLWFGGGKVIDGVLQFGVLYAFVNYINQFFQPINDLAEKYNILQSAMASSERIFMILDTPPEVDAGTVTLDHQRFRGDIEFKNVWFAYKGEEWVLQDVNFKVPAGQTVAIVGATGAGKTSIINLINRFYEIQQGEILIDGIDTRDIRKESLRKNIGVVLQDVFLFSGTVKDNIILNNENIDDEKVSQVSEYVNAHKFIQELPSGYMEEVMERGATFSSGQRQLLAFARVLAFDPPILILDEATANIDTETELLIQDALSRITRNRTTIVIAHRLSTIQHADNIIVLHKGKIREMGNHQELLAKKGMYYNLYNLQYKGQA